VPRATVCFRSDSLEEKVDFTIWLSAWRSKLTFLSRDYGCGGGIHRFDLEGPKEAIDAIPENLLTVSEWTELGINHVPLWRQAPCLPEAVSGPISSRPQLGRQGPAATESVRYGASQTPA
jgi:hypothetical protein